MTQDEKEALIRQYAAGDITWHALRERGFDNYAEVLSGLGALGLKYPVAPMTGPNLAARLRGIEFLRQRFKEQTAP
jgi:hypothetical protein